MLQSKKNIKNVLYKKNSKVKYSKISNIENENIKINSYKNFINNNNNNNNYLNMNITCNELLKINGFRIDNNNNLKEYLCVFKNNIEIWISEIYLTNVKIIIQTFWKQLANNHTNYT